MSLTAKDFHPNISTIVIVTIMLVGPDTFEPLLMELFCIKFRYCTFLTVALLENGHRQKGAIS